jgi:hypothetical protein
MVQARSTGREHRSDDSGLYLYAIVQGLPRRWRPPTLGVGAARVVARPVGDLVVVVSAVERPPVRTAPALALHHDVVANTLVADAVLPFPFGTVIRSDEFEGWLLSHRGLVVRALARLRGCLEIPVRLVRLDAAPTAAVARMLTRRVRVDGAAGRDGDLDSLAREVIDRAGVPEWRYDAGACDGVASLAFLVPRDELGQFLTRIAPVASRAVGVAVVPTGPRAPYSFVPALAESERVVAVAS